MITYLLISLGAFADALDAAVEAAIPVENRHQIEPGKWLINSVSATSKDASDKLGISDSTTFLITPIRAYYGRAKPDVWEWLAAKAMTKANA